jgi:hypothetical protein
VLLEETLLHPVISGQDVATYEPLPGRQYILFPYKVSTGRATLIPLRRIRDESPRIAEYLLKNRQRLEDRETGKLYGKDWHGYIYLKNMARQSNPKICVPRLVNRLHASCDISGEHFLDNVDVCGVTWKPIPEPRSLHLLMALLNSSVLRWYFPHVSAPFRGGFRSANRQFLSLLPIILPAAPPEILIVELVNQLLWLNHHFQTHPGDKTSNDALMLGYWEQVLNGLVYELYFPEELHARGLHLFDLVQQGGLPALEAITRSAAPQPPAKGVRARL